MKPTSPESASIASSPGGIRGKRLATFLRWSVLALLIWCAKLWVIRQQGDSCPFGDEWPWEANLLLKPFQEHTLSWSTLFDPINEHRIFMTRLFVLGLFKVNGIWDPRLQMAVQALLHAACITIFIFLCIRGLAAPLRLLFMVATCPLWILPFGWENTLFGFQSPFYFVMLFGIATIWLLWRHDTFSPGWWIGVLVAAAGFFNLASGLFACAISAGLILSRVWVNPSRWPREIAGFGVLLALSISGFLLIPHVPYSDQFKARTLAELWNAWRQVVSWPEHGRWFFLVLQAPFVLLTVRVLRNRTPIHDRAWLILTLGGWGLLQSLALAYGRGRLTPVAPRYLDVYVLLLCASLACFCEWYQGSTLSTRQRRWSLALAGLWVFCSMHGALSHFVTVTVPELDHWTSLKRAQENTVRQYLESHDATVLSTQPAPFPDPEALQPWLGDPTIVDFLPSNLRPPLSSSRQIPENSFFSRSYFEEGGSPTPGHLRYWSSYGPNGATHTGEMEMKFQGVKKPRLMEFFVAGAPNAENMSLLLSDKGGPARPLAPHADSGTPWKSVLVKIPPGSFSVTAKDGSADQWLAISNPHEVGLLSHYLGRFLQLPESDSSGWFTLPLFTTLVVMLGLMLSLGDALKRETMAETR